MIPAVSLCLNAGGMGRIDGESETFVPVAHSLRAEGFDASEDGTGRGTPLVPVEVCGTMKSCKDSGGWSNSADHAAAGYMVPVAFHNRQDPDVSGPVTHPLGAKDNGMAVAFAENNRAEVRLCGGDGQVAAQLTTGGGKPGQGFPAVAFDAYNQSTSDVSHPLRVGLGDGSGDEIPQVLQPAMQVRRLTPRECERLQGFPDDYTQTPFRNKPAADGPRYKALGNSMAVNVMRWIGERLDLSVKGGVA